MLVETKIEANIAITSASFDLKLKNTYIIFYKVKKLETNEEALKKAKQNRKVSPFSH